LRWFDSLDPQSAAKVHRLAAARRAGRIFVLDSGRFVDAGTAHGTDLARRLVMRAWRRGLDRAGDDFAALPLWLIVVVIHPREAITKVVFEVVDRIGMRGGCERSAESASVQLGVPNDL